MLFGDGAGAAVLGPIDDDGRGVLSTHIFADGRYAEKLWVDGPGLAHDPYVSVEMLEQGLHRAVMEGREVFKFTSLKMPESIAIAWPYACISKLSESACECPPPLGPWLMSM